MEVNLTNLKSSFVLLDGLETIEPRSYLIPNWFLWTYITVICLGGFFTNVLLAGHLARKRSYPVILQLCLTDIATLLFLAPQEILILSDPAGEWPFPSMYCPIYSGLEVLLGTVTIYLLITLNFFSAIGNDQASLKVPLLTVWLLSVSLSVPEFLFAELVTPKPQYNICSVPKRAAILISAFRLSLPVFLLVVGLLVVLTVWIKSDKTKATHLCLPLVLSTSYLVLSVQRNVFGVLYVLHSTVSVPEDSRIPPLADVIHSPIGTLSLSMIHYTLSAVRPLISWSFSSDKPTGSDPPEANHAV